MRQVATAERMQDFRRYGAGTAGWIRTTDLLIHSLIAFTALTFLDFP